VTPTATHAWPASLTGTAGTWTVPNVRQSLAGDPRAALLERQAVMALGYRSRLQIPIRSRGRSLGTLEALALEERPWSRFEIRRARIAAAGLGAALAHLEPGTAPPAPALPR
jgi:GAF domain-containing protein